MASEPCPGLTEPEQFALLAAGILVFRDPASAHHPSLRLVAQNSAHSIAYNIPCGEQQRLGGALLMLERVLVAGAGK